MRRIDSPSHRLARARWSPCHFTNALLAAMLVLAASAQVSAEETSFLFAPAHTVQLPTGQFPSHVAVGDLNNDGNVDLFVTGRNNDGRIFAIRGNGDGTYGSPREYIIETHTDWAALADLDGNGFLDVALAVRSYRGRVAVMLNNGGSFGSFAPPVFYETGRLVQGVAASDFTNDGRIDLLSVNTNSGDVRVLHNIGDGQFHVLPPLPIAEWVSGHPNPNHVTVADFTGDGRPDLSVTALGSGRFNIAQATGPALFSSPVGYRAPPDPLEGTFGYSNTIAADMTGNGRLDIVTPMASLGGGQYFGVWENDGQGRFAAPELYIGAFGGLAWHAGVGDFDGDGRLDVVVSYALSHKISFHRNITEDGNLAFAERQEIGNVGQFVRTVLAVDVNNNGIVDLVYTDYPAHRVVVRLNVTPQGGGASAGAAVGDEQQHGIANAIDSVRDKCSDPSEDDSDSGAPPEINLAALLANVGDINRDGKLDVIDLLMALDSLGEEPLP
jgi:hypothetical protein